MRTLVPRRLAAFAVALALSCGAPAMANTDDPWPGIRKDAFENREIVETADMVLLEAPVRAEDAALVPLTVRIPAHVSPNVKKLSLVIDKNPAPVVATFAFGPAAGAGERVLSTRVRVDMYSNVRAIAELADGKLVMATKFVKAAGGCSAPALKDADEALAAVGRMQVKTVDSADAAAPQGQVMIKHPQYSGMQMNQLTGLYIPAKFITEMEVKSGADVVFRMEGGISLSEDPNIRFSYAPSPDNTIEVTAKDTDGRVFTGRSVPKGS